MGRLVRLGDVGWVEGVIGVIGVGGGLGKRWCLAKSLLAMGWSCEDLKPAL